METGQEGGQGKEHAEAGRVMRGAGHRLHAARGWFGDNKMCCVNP